MEKKDHLNSDFKRSFSERSKLISETEKVPETQKEVANSPFYDMTDNRQAKGV